jgi:hypothetical protein
VRIASTAAEFLEAIQQALAQRTSKNEAARLQAVDKFLAKSSWDQTWFEMRTLIVNAASSKKLQQVPKQVRLTANNTASAD